MQRPKKAGAISFGIIFLLVLAACLPSQTDKDGTPSPTFVPVSLPATWTALPASNIPTSDAEPSPAQTATPNQAALTPQSEPFDAGEGLPFESFDMIDPQTGWAWGFIQDRGMTFWRTSDGAQTWIEVTPSTRPMRFEFALDAQTAWATVCPTPSGDCEETLAMTTDGGENWIVFSEPYQTTIPSFHFDSENTGWLSSYDVAAGGGFWRFSETNDGGLTWNRVEIVSSHPGGSADLTFGYQTCNRCGDLLYLDHTRLMMLEGNLLGTPAETITTWASFNRGASWREVVLDLPSDHNQLGLYHAYAPVFFEDGGGILAYEVVEMSDQPSTMIFYTARDGLNWRLQSFVENAGDVNRWNAMQLLSSQEILFACGSDLCVTRDGAQTWDRISSNLNFDNTAQPPRVASIDFVDGQNGWALVASAHDTFTLWGTTDGGRNWVELEPTFVYQ